VRATPKFSVEFLSSVFLISPMMSLRDSVMWRRTVLYSCQRIVGSCCLRTLSPCISKTMQQVNRKVCAWRHMPDDRKQSTECSKRPQHWCRCCWVFINLNFGHIVKGFATLRECGSKTDFGKPTETLRKLLVSNWVSAHIEHKAPKKSNVCAILCVCVCVCECLCVSSSGRRWISFSKPPSRSGQTGVPKMHRDIVGSGTHTNTVQITWQHWQLPIC